ncbi:hypothetical protein COCVIDRAFT_32092 [Bipolaris victoriae FI3]|uniref:Uncharacterized protein n=1 Tax=Bipolaris victoriae (strain FI3) TaxID=930091 RepID=W7DQF0_BIPV3|nr:hypothetical protein COCVIDRAFT_32092 [Bipolaris victoriae FI3]
MGKAQDHDITQLIERAFASAVRLTTDNARTRMYLCYYYGLLFYYNSCNANDILEAIALWETNIQEDDPLDGTSIDMVRNKSIRKVITAYLDLCKLQPEYADPKDEHLKALLKLQKKRPGVFDRSENSWRARLYHRSIKSKNEAKKQIEPYVIEALTLLSDGILGPNGSSRKFQEIARALHGPPTPREIPTPRASLRYNIIPTPPQH